MEQVDALWTGILRRWEGWAGVPDLDLPAPPDPVIVAVLATVIGAMGLAAALTAWAERRRSLAGLFAAVVAVLLFFWLWEADRSISWTVVPDSFIELIARILR
ncbi:hypothetical protein [Jannaschia sp. W003]|uniref:hypothetical protein n=1 Tax=Jannaschia sp. W003 TaxID=2867012 RepID=UPI0021A2ABCC|nr:hypothetical protein [Jannaschia sp. W003]UWQ22324.1 hypothetical protein K3554_04625 [Jannaschia sp. W003]